MTVLHTTLGPRTREELGLVLPHEHVFVDLRTPDVQGHGTAEPADVVALMAPQVEAAVRQGVTAIVECSTGGVGRRADLDREVSVVTGLPIVMASGFYREPWVPGWLYDASDADTEKHIEDELTTGLDGTDVLAAWIKLSAGDDGITEIETRILRAAARAAIRHGALIGSHTIRGAVALAQLDLVQSEGMDPARFLWIHTQMEQNLQLHHEFARRGGWIEYDHIGQVPDADVVALVKQVVDAGLERRLLLSHDAGWYDPAVVGGGTPRPFTTLAASLIPALARAGISSETIRVMTHENPFDAFSR